MKHKLIFIVMIFGILLVSGCAQTSETGSDLKYPDYYDAISTDRMETVTFNHSVEIFVKNELGNPVEGARVFFSHGGQEMHPAIVIQQYLTDEKGYVMIPKEYVSEIYYIVPENNRTQRPTDFFVYKQGYFQEEARDVIIHLFNELPVNTTVVLRLEQRINTPEIGLTDEEQAEISTLYIEYVESGGHDYSIFDYVASLGSEKGLKTCLSFDNTSLRDPCLRILAYEYPEKTDEICSQASSWQIEACKSHAPILIF